MGRIRRIQRTAALGLVAALLALVAVGSPAHAQTGPPTLLAPPFALVLAQVGPPPVLLGAADRFAVLGGTTITSTGLSAINGDLGLHPGTSVVGFPPGTVNGAQHVGDAVAKQAKTDLTNAYNDAAGRPSSATSPPDVGGRTLTPGVYRTGSVASLGLTGRLTLDARGDPRAVFIFQIASTLGTATDSSVSLINGAQACNVYWQVGSSATLGTRTAFQGNILALTSISVNNGVTVNGRLLARNGAGTLINDTVTRSRCAAGTAPALQVRDTRLSRPAVIGRDTSVVVEAIDTRAPVSGLSVQFGRGPDVFGSSACQPPDSEGNVPRAFTPGPRTRLAAPHRFRKRGRQKVLVRVDSGGCSSPLTGVYQTATVTPTSPGQRPRPLIVGAPTLVKPPGALLPPILPAGFASASGVPGLPGLPITRAASRGPVLVSRKRRCAGAGRRVRRSAKSIRAARKSLLCLLNVQRRARGLPGLRSNRRLVKAAERHSRSMVARGFFSHVEPGGLGVLDRVNGSGYFGKVRNWSIGENIGFGRGPGSSPSYMTRAWMASTPHRANILARKFREIGLGIVTGVPGNKRAGATYTTDFGRRR